MKVYAYKDESRRECQVITPSSSLERGDALEATCGFCNTAFRPNAKSTCECDARIIILVSEEEMAGSFNPDCVLPMIAQTSEPETVNSLSLDLIGIEESNILRLKPGDILVATVNAAAPQAALNRIRVTLADTIHKAGMENVPVLVLNREVRLGIVRQEGSDSVEPSVLGDEEEGEPDADGTA